MIAFAGILLITAGAVRGNQAADATLRTWGIERHPLETPSDRLFFGREFQDGAALEVPRVASVDHAMFEQLARSGTPFIVTDIERGVHGGKKWGMGGPSLPFALYTRQRPARRTQTDCHSRSVVALACAPCALWNAALLIRSAL
jgi:hypothetical protein